MGKQLEQPTALETSRSAAGVAGTIGRTDRHRENGRFGPWGI